MHATVTLVLGRYSTLILRRVRYFIPACKHPREKRKNLSTISRNLRSTTTRERLQQRSSYPILLFEHLSHFIMQCKRYPYVFSFHLASFSPSPLLPLPPPALSPHIITFWDFPGELTLWFSISLTWVGYSMFQSVARVSELLSVDNYSIVRLCTIAG